MTNTGKIIVTFILGIVISVGGFLFVTQTEPFTDNLIVSYGSEGVEEIEYNGKEITQEQGNEIIEKAYKEKEEIKITVKEKGIERDYTLNEFINMINASNNI